MNKLCICLMAMLGLLLAGCKDNNVEQAFNQVSEFIQHNGKGQTHFVHIEEELLGHYFEQRDMSRKLCDDSSSNRQCEVYFWKNKKDIPSSFPFKTSYNKRIKLGKGSLPADIERGHYKRDVYGNEDFQLLGKKVLSTKSGLTQTVKRGNGSSWSQQFSRN